MRLLTRQRHSRVRTAHQQWPPCLQRLPCHERYHESSLRVHVDLEQQLVYLLVSARQ